MACLTANNFWIHIMTDYNASFDYNCFYHVYNRGNNKEDIFLENENYSFFLNKWYKYLVKYVNIWAYCLLPNHFHLIVEVKSKQELNQLLAKSRYDSIPRFISNQFRTTFISYAKSFNKVYNRTGSLFQKPFKRIKISTRDYLLTLIHYIHHNPIHHCYTEDFTDWEFSSYRAIIGSRETKLEREKVLNLFDGKNKFIEFHAGLKEYKKVEHLLIEPGKA